MLDTPVWSASPPSPTTSPQSAPIGTHRARRRALAGAAALLLALGAATGAMAAPHPATSGADLTAAARQVLTTEHTDAVSVFLDGGALRLATKADLGPDRGVRLDPDSVIFHVTDAAQRAAPSGSAFAFLGVAPGSPVHVIPQSYTAGVLWAGWNTESVPPSAVDGPITLTWEQVSGPGAVEVYESGLDGPQRLFSSRDSALRSLPVPANTHAHASWAFTAPGIYTITVGASARTPQGATLTAPSRTYVFAVGGTSLPALSTAVDLQAQATGGGQVELSASVRWNGTGQATPPEGRVEFLHLTGGVESLLGYASASAGTAHLTASVPGGGQLVARFAPTDPQLVEGATSATVTNPLAATTPQVTGLHQQYQPGEQVELALEGYDSLAPHSARWTVERVGAAEPEQHAGWSLSMVAAEDLDGARVVVDLEDVDGGLLGQTPPVVIRVAASPTPSPSPSPSPSPPPSSPAADPPPPAEGTPAPTAAQVPQAVDPGTDPACLPTPVTETVDAGTVDIVDDGHLDLGPTVREGRMVPQVKDDRSGTPVWRSPEELVLHLDASSRTPVPAGGDFSFLGTGHVWTIPLAQRSGVPWLGWNTQHPTIAGRAAGPITMTLESVDGPGNLAVYSLDTFGGVGERYFGNVEGFPRSTAIPVGAAGAHVHGVWAFTAEGTYRVTIGFSGTVDGSALSGSATLTFAVGDVDPTTAAQTTTVTRYVGRTADGQECELDPSQTGGALAATGLDDQSLADLGIVSGVLLAAGIALAGLSAVGREPRRRRANPTVSPATPA